MSRPFPGIDPSIEAQGRWPDFYSRFLIYCCDALEDRLPASYSAQIEEQVHLVRTPDDLRTTIRPDFSVLRIPGGAGFPGRGPAIATLEPTTFPLIQHDLEEFRERWIEIRRLPDLALATMVELLSPSNKIGDGRAEYLEKRAARIDRPVHIVELDL